VVAGLAGFAGKRHDLEQAACQRRGAIIRQRITPPARLLGPASTRAVSSLFCFNDKRTVVPLVQASSNESGPGELKW
jgi:hypothetical protein